MSLIIPLSTIVAVVVILGLHFAGHRRASPLWHARTSAAWAVVFAVTVAVRLTEGRWALATIDVACVVFMAWLAHLSYGDVRRLDGAR